MVNNWTALLPALRHVYRSPERLGIIGELMWKLDSESLKYRYKEEQFDKRSRTVSTGSEDSNISDIIEDDGDSDSTS